MRANDFITCSSKMLLSNVSEAGVIILRNKSHIVAV